MILIIKNGYNEIQITRYLDEETEIISSFDTLDLDRCKNNLYLYTMIIILGSHLSLLELSKHKNLLDVIEFIKLCIENKKRILGICLGCQLLAHIYGSEIKTLGQLVHGYTDVLHFTNIFRSHVDYIVPNDQIEIICMCDSMPYVFKIKGASIYGIQCHPDIGPDYISKAYTDLDIRGFALENEHNIESNNKKFMEYLLEKLRS